MTCRNNKAFTLSEVVVAVAILLLAISIAVTATISLNKDYKILIGYLSSYMKGREVMEVISKDVRMAVRVMDSYGGYVTTDSSLVLKVPSIDGGGDIINADDTFDYIIYRVVSGDLWKTVIPSAVSGRSPKNGILKKSVDSLYMESEGVGLSLIPHKSVITRVSVHVSINEGILGKDYTIIPGTTIKLMNYEWEYVR